MHQAADAAGLLSFALPQVARRRSAPNRARKAPAAMHRLMCRCQPCQARLAMIEAQVVLGALEALLDGPAQTGRAGELGEAGARRSKGEVVGSLVRRLAAAADQHPVL